MTDPKNIEKLKKQGWDDMESLLDQHMPVSRTGFHISRYAAAAVLALLLIPFYFWYTSDSPAAFLNSDPLSEKTEIPGLSAGSDKMQQRMSARETESTLENKAFSPDDEKTGPGVNKAERPTAVTFIASADIIAEKEIEKAPAATLIKFATNSPAAYESTYGEEKTLSADQIVDYLPHPTIVAQATQPAFETLPAPDRIDTDKKGNRHWKFLARTQSLWAPSDRFLFLQAGPGVQFSMRKWAYTISAGPSFPIAIQRSFGYKNVLFEDRYFAGNLDYAFTQSGKLNQEITNSLVYYERYKPNPGFMASGDVSYRILPQWEVAAEAGKIWFSYDYQQRTFPNQFVPQASYEPNLKSELFYIGLKTGYHLTDHLSVHAGVTNINAFSKRNRSWLTNLAVQYIF